jgi:hypothetical protein
LLAFNLAAKSVKCDGICFKLKRLCIPVLVFSVRWFANKIKESKMRRFKFAAVLVIAFLVPTGMSQAAGNGVEWRLDAATFLEKKYTETSRVVDLLVAMLSNPKYNEQIFQEAWISKARGRDCGNNFVLMRAAKAKGIDVPSVVTLLGDIVSPEDSDIIRDYDHRNGRHRTRVASDYLLVPFSPATAEIFWVINDILEPDQALALTKTFEKMAPLWRAVLQETKATGNPHSGSPEIGLSWVEKSKCAGSINQYTYGSYVPFLKDGATEIFGHRLDDDDVLVRMEQMPLVQLELLEAVLAFSEALDLSGTNWGNGDRKHATLGLQQIQQIKARKLETFDDLDLGGSPSPDAGAGEFDDLNFDDLDLDIPDPTI